MCHRLPTHIKPNHHPYSAPFNITIVQVYAPTTDHEDSEVEKFYEQVQDVLDKIPKKEVIVVKGDWNAKVGRDTTAN